jgi:hypothetical protein
VSFVWGALVGTRSARATGKSTGVSGCQLTRWFVPENGLLAEIGLIRHVTRQGGLMAENGVLRHGLARPGRLKEVHR